METWFPFGVEGMILKAFWLVLQCCASSGLESNIHCCCRVVQSVKFQQNPQLHPIVRRISQSQLDPHEFKSAIICHVPQLTPSLSCSQLSLKSVLGYAISMIRDGPLTSSVDVCIQDVIPFSCWFSQGISSLDFIVAAELKRCAGPSPSHVVTKADFEFFSSQSTKKKIKTQSVMN